MPSKLKYKQGKASAQVKGGGKVEVEEKFGELHVISIDPESPWFGKLRQNAIIRMIDANGRIHRKVSAADFREATGRVRIEFEYVASGKGFSKILPIDFHDDYVDSESEDFHEEDSIEIELDIHGDSPHLELSESIYTAAIVIPVAFDSWGCGNLFRAAQVIFLYFLNVFAQFALSLYVRYMWLQQGEDGAEDENTEITTCGPYDLVAREFKVAFALQVICILVYTAVVVGDVVETCGMAMWILYSPTSRNCSPMKVSWNDDESFTVIRSGIPCCAKLFGLVIVVGSKLMVASTLLIWGGGYILGSPTNEDLLLNALAISFIMDIDEIMFTLFLPRSIQAFCKSLPSVVAETSVIKGFTAFASIFGMTLNVGFLSAGASVTWRYFCADVEPAMLSSTVPTATPCFNGCD